MSLRRPVYARSASCTGPPAAKNKGFIVAGPRSRRKREFHPTWSNIGDISPAVGSAARCDRRAGVRVGPFRTLIDFPGFQDGFWWGLLATGVVLGAGWVAVSIRRGSGTPLGLAGPAWVLVSLGLLGGWIGSNRTDVIPSGLLWGLLVLVIGGELADRTPNPIFVGMVFSVPGAFIVGLSREFPGPAWTKWVVIGVVAIGGPLAADLDRRTARLGLGPLLWLVAVAGVYWTVPDTERVRPLIGAAVPLAFCGWPKQWSRMGAGGIGAAVGVFAWVAAIEGRGRPGSIVGAAASLGLFLVEPIGRRLTKGRLAALSRSVKLGVYECCLLGSQLLVVGYASRVVGLEETGADAVLLLVPALPIAVALGGFVRASERLRPGSGRSSVRRRTHPARRPTTRGQP